MQKKLNMHIYLKILKYILINLYGISIVLVLFVFVNIRCSIGSIV